MKNDTVIELSIAKPDKFKECRSRICVLTL